MKRKKFLMSLLTIIVISGFLVIGQKVEALTFNTSNEDLWGAGKTSALTNTTASGGYKWRCDAVSGSTGLITIDNTNGCVITATNVFTNSTVKIRITRTANSNGNVETKEKTLNLRANAATASIKVGDTYDAGPAIKNLGLQMMAGTCINNSGFTVSNDVLTKTDCASWKYVVKANKAGTSTIEVPSASGIKFRVVVSVTAVATTTTTRVATPTACSNITTKSTCESYSGCSWLDQFAQYSSSPICAKKSRIINFSKGNSDDFLDVAGNVMSSHSISCTIDSMTGTTCSVPANTTRGVIPKVRKAGNFVFDGWYSQPGGLGTKFSSNNGTTASMTLNASNAVWWYAHWRASTPTTTTAPNSCTKIWNETTCKSYPGCSWGMFDDYFDSYSCASKTLYISFDKGNSDSIAMVSPTFYCTITAMNNNYCSVTTRTIPTAVKSGNFAFDGWYDATPSGNTCNGTKMFSSNGGQAGGEISIDKAAAQARGGSLYSGMKLYACWKSSSTPGTTQVTTTIKPPANSNTYTLYLDHNNGSGSRSSISCTTTGSSCAQTLPAGPTRANSEFKGWDASPSCSSGQTGTITLSSTLNGKTWYACWKTTNIDVPPPPNVGTDVINDYRYAQAGASFSGTAVNCGDQVYVTTCDNNRSDTAICRVSKINGITVSYSEVYRQKLMVSKPTTCGSYVRYAKGDTWYFNDPGLIGWDAAKTLKCGEPVVFDKIIVDSCKYGPLVAGSSEAYQYCEAKYNGQTIYVNRLDLLSTMPTNCPPDKPEDPPQPPQPPQPPSTGEVCLPRQPQTNVTSSIAVQLPVCYIYENNDWKVNGPNANELYQCAPGYRSDHKEIENDNTCNKITNPIARQECHIGWSFRCVPTRRPIVAGSGSLVRPDGKGVLRFSARSGDPGVGIEGYFISDGSVKPNMSSQWTKFPDQNNQVYLDKPTGSYFVWAKNAVQIISYSSLFTIFDGDASTTANSISVGSADGSQTFSLRPVDAGGTTGYLEPTDKNIALMSSNLANANPLAAGFDSFKTSYELTVSTDKIAVYATLTSNDASYVPGFEPRTVELEYGNNVILIKIQNKKGKVRTYTFIVERTDERESINTLSSLSLSRGKANFNPYISDYTISVPKNTKSVAINGTLTSGKSAFVVGYEPRTIELTGDITSAVLKVISEAGIIRNYVITFIKTGAVDNTNVENSVYLNSLTIPGTEIIFDKTTVSYSVAVDYTVTQVPIFALPESSKAWIEVIGNVGLKVGPNLVEVLVNNGSKTKLYTVYVNRKEDGLGVSNNTKLNTLTVKDYNINFNPDVQDYTIKIRREKTLLLSATPASNRSEVYMYGNNDLTAFSTVRVKVIAENGETGLYSVDIIKDAYNRDLEKTVAIFGSIIVIGGVIIVLIRKKHKAVKAYVGE